MGVKRGVPFGKASKEKRSKPEAEEEAQPELEIELDETVADEELAEVFGLFAKLQEQRDPRVARGLVHECDRLLRERDSKGETLPPLFHVAYASALLRLSDPTVSEEEAEGLQRAGLERLDTGIDALGDDLAVAGIAAQELVQFLHTQVENAKLSPASATLVDKVVALLKRGVHAEIAKAAFQFVQLTDELEDLEQTPEVVKVLEAHAAAEQDETARLWAHRGLGSQLLNDAARADSAAEEAGKVPREILDTAIEHLRQGVSETDAQSHVLLAEALLQLGGVLEEETEDADVSEVYAEALRHLKKAQLLGHEDLREVIESLEA